MFDNLVYVDLTLRSFEICDFRNMGVYFHFKTVDLSSLTFRHFISTRQNILDKVACNLIFSLRTMVTCISCLTSILPGAKPARHLVIQMHSFCVFDHIRNEFLKK